jgi:hypothetical protein
MQKKCIVFAMLLALNSLILFSCKKDNNNNNGDHGPNPNNPPVDTVKGGDGGGGIVSGTNPGNIYDVEVIKGAGTGATIYVATNGNDAAAGTISAPLKTLTKAVSLVKPGGIIIMRAGTYQGAVVNTGFGTANAWVTLQAAPGEAVTLQGNPRGTSVATIYFYNSGCDEYAAAGSVCASAYWRIKGIKIMSVSGGSADANCVKVDMPHVQIDSCTLCCAVPDIIKIVRTANNVAILNSEIFADASVVKPGGNSQGIDITGADNIRASILQAPITFVLLVIICTIFLMLPCMRKAMRVNQFLPLTELIILVLEPQAKDTMRLCSDNKLMKIVWSTGLMNRTTDWWLIISSAMYRALHWQPAPALIHVFITIPATSQHNAVTAVCSLVPKAALVIHLTKALNL